MSVVIKPCTIEEMESFPNIQELLEEYAIESAIGGLPHPSAKVETYKNLQKIGAINVIGAFVDDVFAGYIIVLAPVMPHYGFRIAVGESFFVAKQYRKSGAGLKLLSAAEEYAKESDALGLLMSAPFGGNLAEVLPHVGYTETNRVFFKRCGHE